jgi:uroporphyrinogen-III synthase
MRLLVTRPEPDAQRTAAMLSARGHRVQVGPLLKIEVIPGADIGRPPWDAVLMTSANAARAIARHPKLPQLRGLAVLAVGLRTAEAAHDAGFPDVDSAEGGAGDLIRLVERRFGRGARLLYLAGTDRARDLTADLAPAGIEARTVEVYRAHAAEELPPGTVAALRASELDGVLHFSRRTAEIFVQCAKRAGVLAEGLRLLQFCISAHAAEPLARAGAQAENIRIAAQPDEDALVGLIGPP